MHYSSAFMAFVEVWCAFGKSKPYTVPWMEERSDQRASILAGFSGSQGKPHIPISPLTSVISLLLKRYLIQYGRLERRLESEILN